MSDTKRIAYIDTLRGILILLMVSTHAIGLSHVASSSFLKSVFWLPRGWAGISFIILSGFTLPNVLSWTDNNHDYLRHRLFRRAWILFIVMFVSNVVSLLLQYLKNDELHRILNINWWTGLFTFRTEYTISAALLPIAVLVALAPLLFAILDMVRSISFMAVTLLWTLFIWWIGAGSHHGSSVMHCIDVLLFGGVGGAGYPILPCLSYGLIGFGLGALKREYSLGCSPSIVLGTVLFSFAVKLLPTEVFRQTLTGISHFLILLLVAVGFHKSPGINRGVAFLGNIGQSALFCFVVHRPVSQALALINQSPIPSNLAYGLNFVGTMGFLILLCRCPAYHPLFSRFLKTGFRATPPPTQGA